MREKSERLEGVGWKVFQLGFPGPEFHSGVLCQFGPSHKSGKHPQKIQAGKPRHQAPDTLPLVEFLGSSHLLTSLPGLSYFIC
jgi:hypothetical protein